MPEVKGYDFEYCSDKDKVFKAYCDYMFTRTQSMFVYEGLPDTIPVEWLEMYLQRNGQCAIAKVNGEIYALSGNPGGEDDVYGQPTLYTVANPALNLSETYTIGEDCVYAKNDFSAVGLIPLICRYSGLMTENLLTVRISDINMRMMSLLSASDDRTVQSTKQYLNDLEAGKLGVVGETPFFDGIKLQSKGVGNGDYMIQFIELQQYLKGSLYNELGINANFNMKREALSGEEVALNDDALMPLIDDMLKQRRAMCDDINELFGLEVSVDYGSTWHSNTVEKQLLSEEEMGAEDSEAEEMGGDESALPDDKDPNAVDEGVNSVSQLKDDAREESEDKSDAGDDVDSADTDAGDKSDSSETDSDDAEDANVADEADDNTDEDTDDGNPNSDSDGDSKARDSEARDDSVGQPDDDKEEDKEDKKGEDDDERDKDDKS